MTLVGLELTNFRCISHLVLEFEQGVTGIIGENGSGKSSIIEAILFALTGNHFGESKAEMLKLGSDSGFVKLTFELNGNRGTIERHLDISKTLLTYDGVTYKKANDVKELWDKLLQVNTEIVERVIIARQGEIPLLFCGDATVRERVFQRIFLVPNTEKLRNLIFKSYIRQAPPVLPLEDLSQLNASINGLTKEVEKLTNQLNELTLLTFEEKQQIHSRISYIDHCIEDRTKAEALHGALENVSNRYDELVNELTTHEDWLSAIDIGNFQRQYEMLLRNQTLAKRKQELLDTLSGLDKPMSHDEYLATQDKLIELNAALREEEDKLLLSKTELAKKKRELSELAEFNGATQCPTCGQEIKHIQEHIEHLEKEISELEAELETVHPELKRIKTNSAGLMELLNLYTQYCKKVESIEDQLRPLSDIEANDEDLRIFKELIDTYREEESIKQKLVAEITTIQAEKRLLTEQIQQLKRYDQEADPYQEKEALANLLLQDIEDNRRYQVLNVNTQVKQAELRTLLSRKEVHEQNLLRNKKRDEYLKTLNAIYDVLHHSNFPRKLIQDYSEVVTDHLQERLSAFGFPYEVRVADNFKIEVLDEDGNVLPSVSGGEQMQIGISLHLALHDLFSQSFPLMILDEGTTHLSDKKREAYFEMISKLRTDSGINQVIIIDHYPALIDVVDQAITIKKENTE